MFNRRLINKRDQLPLLLGSMPGQARKKKFLDHFFYVVEKKKKHMTHYKTYIGIQTKRRRRQQRRLRMTYHSSTTPACLYRPKLPSWVIREYIEHVSARVLQRFAMMVLKKRRAIIVLQNWWKKDPQFEYL